MGELEILHDFLMFCFSFLRRILPRLHTSLSNIQRRTYAKGEFPRSHHTIIEIVILILYL